MHLFFPLLDYLYPHLVLSVFNALLPLIKLLHVGCCDIAGFRSKVFMVFLSLLEVTLDLFYIEIFSFFESASEFFIVDLQRVTLGVH